MIKFTESELIVNDLYGSGCSISPQLGITYDPTFISSQQSSIPSIADEVQIACHFLQGINTSNSCMPTDRDLIQRKQKVLAHQEANIGNTATRILSLDLKRSTLQAQKKKENARQGITSNLTFNLLSTIEKLSHQIMLKDSQIKHLKDKVQAYQAKFLSQDKPQSEKKVVNQQEQEQPKQDLIKISKKLKYYQTKSSSLQNANNQLFQKFNALRSKLESQFEELHRFQIQNMQSLMLFEKQRSQAQRAQLLQRLTQYDQTIRRLQKQLKEKLKHECNACRQYELAQSVSSLKRNIEQLKSQNSQLKMSLGRTAMKQKEELMKVSQMESTMSAEFEIKSQIFQ